MCYFAAQFEKSFQVDREVPRGKQEKRSDKRCFFHGTQCIPAKSGEYHPLLSLIGILVLSYKLKDASMAIRPRPSH